MLCAYCVIRNGWFTFRPFCRGRSPGQPVGIWDTGRRGCRPLQSMSRPTPGLASPSGWCCAQRIQIFMIAGGNHTEISGTPQGRRGCPIVRGYALSVKNQRFLPAPPEVEPSPFGDKGRHIGRPGFYRKHIPIDCNLSAAIEIRIEHTINISIRK